MEHSQLKSVTTTRIVQRHYANAVRSKPARRTSTDIHNSSCVISPQKSEEDSRDGLLPEAVETLSAFRFRTLFKGILVPMCKNPLPRFKWADSRRLWKVMVQKEKLYPRNPNLFQNHPVIQPNMRSILLDWLIEVL